MNCLVVCDKIRPIPLESRGVKFVANWDIFHSDRLETERDLTSGTVRAGVASGAISPDDLIRPAGATTPWTRVGEVPSLGQAKPAAKPTPAPAPAPKREPPPPAARAKPEPPPPPVAKAKPEPPPELPPEPLFPSLPPGPELDLPFLHDEEDAPPMALFADDDDDDDDVRNIEVADAIILPEDEEDEDEEPKVADAVIVDDDDDEDDDEPVLHVSAPKLTLPGPHGRETFGQFADEEASSAELVTWDDDLDFDPLEEDEAATAFTLTRKSAETVEELDLAAMVDVAFQLVLFFLVTATTILYKSLEVPKPNPETKQEAAAAGNPKTLDDMQDVFILVQIDTNGNVKIDHEPIQPDMNALISALRKARESTDRRAMLLSADFTTPHKAAVLAYDAANEIGLSIAIARPAPPNPNAPPPAPPPAPAPAAKGG
jgi:biopolymer transport protein ExbD